MAKDRTKTAAGNEMTNLELVASELATAKKKRQFFASELIDPTQPIAWAESERQIKQRNSHGPWTADNIILEKLAEAFAAVEISDLAQARQKLAQCAAGCIWVMEKIEKKMEETKWNSHGSRSNAKSARPA